MAGRKRDGQRSKSRTVRSATKVGAFALDVVTSPLFYAGLPATIAALYTFGYVAGTNNARHRHLGGLTAHQVVEKTIMNKRGFDKELEALHTVEDIFDRAKEHLGNYDTMQDVNNYLNFGWRATQYWLRGKQEDLSIREHGTMSLQEIMESALGGDCTEGTNLNRQLASIIKNLPGGGTLVVTACLQTWIKTDRSQTSGHEVMMGEITNKGGNKEYFIMGINPWEDPRYRFASKEEALQGMLMRFRHYAFKALTEAGVGITIDRWADFVPEDYGIPLKYDTMVPGKPLSKKRSIWAFEKMSEVFETLWKRYEEPKAKNKKPPKTSMYQRMGKEDQYIRQEFGGRSAGKDCHWEPSSRCSAPHGAARHERYNSKGYAPVISQNGRMVRGRV